MVHSILNSKKAHIREYLYTTKKHFKNLIVLVIVCGSFALPVYAQTTVIPSPLDINGNGILDKDESSVTVTSNVELPAGEYFFNDLIIANNATLLAKGNQYSSDAFKGVRINAINITVQSGSRISADGEGYANKGPGSSINDIASSYGGAGGGNTATSTYGSATMPIDLGSGTGDYKGGGAINLVVSDTLLNDGDISSSGGLYRTSGGSIYTTTNKLSGIGTFNANGGGTSWPYQFAGGGGRIAIYYQQSTFTGNAKANAGGYCFYGCNPAGGEGTVAFFDTANNDLYPKGFFRFQANDAPFNFHDVVVANGTSVEIEKGVNINANSISIKDLSGVTIKDVASLNVRYFGIDRNSFLDILGAPTLNISTIDIGKGSTLTMSGDETLTAGTININNGGILTIAKEHTLSLTVSNLNISADSFISANAKGYGAGVGQGVPATYYAGASYGGVGLWNSATSTYGSAEEPVDFGSGGNGHLAQGGGAIRIIVTDTLSNNGTIYANGSRTSSGGSIYITANSISGSGNYSANGGALYCSSVCYGVGGGGRVALYYVTSSFTGGVFAKGGCSRYDGWSFTCGGDGTTVVKKVESVCQTDCYSNVLFLPGLEASRLYQRDLDCYAINCENQLWEPNRNDDVKKLFLDAQGKSIRNDIYTKDIIDEAYATFVGPNIYNSFSKKMDHLKKAGTITDWADVPYDWRLSLEDILSSGNKLPDGSIHYSGTDAATSTPYVIQELRRLAKNSKTGKVTIVAHSNGGLVTKALMQKLGDAEAKKLIDKIVFVAVPQAGTPQAIGAILHGYDQGLPVDWMPFTLNHETARTLAQNMPSAYNLLPSENYFTYVDDPVVKFDDSDILAEFRSRYGTEIHSGEMLRNFITDTRRNASSTPSDTIYPSVGNATLLSQAEAVHRSFDTWEPPQGISLYEVAGWGEDTLATIEYYQGKKTVCKEVQMSAPYTGTYCLHVVVPTIMYRPKEVVDGDGTVVVPSALWSSATTTKKYWVNLLNYNEKNLDRKHADILEVPELRTLVDHIITNATSTPFTFITSTQPTSDAADNKRLHFILHSPLDLSATDNLGNRASSATSTIPGSRYKRYGEVQVLTVPKNTPITLSLDGYASGSFTLDIEEIDGNNAVIASSTLSAIPSATSTKATMTFADGTLQSASPLLVDYDGNGTNDFTLKTKIGKEIVFDTTPPEARISFGTSTKKLLIEGIDENFTTVTTNASYTMITDEAGNTIEIFLKMKQEGKEIKMEIQELRYNGVPASGLSKNVLQYEWSTDKVGNIKELEQKATIGDMKASAHYDAKKNETKIQKKLKEKDDDENGDDDKKEIKETLLGLRALKLVSDKGSMDVDY